jgi:hypothetical protein
MVGTKNLKIAALSLLVALVGGLTPATAADSTSTHVLEGEIMQSQKGSWILRLPARLVVTIGDESASSRDVQLVGISETGSVMLNNLHGKTVRLHGTLGLAHTRHHTEPVIFVVNDSAIRRLAAAAAKE